MVSVASRRYWVIHQCYAGSVGSWKYRSGCVGRPLGTQASAGTIGRYGYDSPTTGIDRTNKHLVFFVFALVGAAQAGYQLSGFTLVFAFSPPAERTTYIGVANLALAPVAAIGPMFVGLLATFAGYHTMFVLLALVGMAGIGCSSGR